MIPLASCFPQFSNLILDDLKIDHLTDEDKTFLEEFTNLELLSMNQTSIKTLKNFPDAPNLVRVSAISEGHRAQLGAETHNRAFRSS